MAIRAINTYTQTVTPAVAAAWLGFKYDKQRPLNDVKVKQLIDAMQRGRFTTNTIKFCVFGESRNLVNGQHTLNAVVKSGVTITLPVQDFVVETDSDVATLYYHEDTNRIRTFADSARATDLGKNTGLAPDAINRLSGALRWIKGNFGTDKAAMWRVTQDDLLEWVPLWVSEMNMVFRAISPCSQEDRANILRQPVLSVALITMRYKPDLSVDFWRQVARDDMLPKDDARKALRIWLSKNVQKRGSYSVERKPPYVASRACADAWNLWCRGTPRQTISVSKDKTTAILALAHCKSFNGNQSPNYLPLSPSPLLSPSQMAT